MQHSAALLEGGHARPRRAPQTARQLGQGWAGRKKNKTGEQEGAEGTHSTGKSARSAALAWQLAVGSCRGTPTTASQQPQPLKREGQGGTAGSRVGWYR